MTQPERLASAHFVAVQSSIPCALLWTIVSVELLGKSSQRTIHHCDLARLPQKPQASEQGSKARLAGLFLQKSEPRFQYTFRLLRTKSRREKIRAIKVEMVIELSEVTYLKFSICYHE